MDVPYFLFLEEDGSILLGLPKNKAIVVVCAKQGSAEFVAEFLLERGNEAVALEGGMLDWSHIISRFKSTLTRSLR